MGTIGHDVLLHRLRLWQIRAAIRGQYRRDHSNFDAMRLHGWWVLNALGAKDLHKPTDLAKFPWDKRDYEGGGDIPTDEEIEQLRREMAEYNEAVQK